MKLTAIVLLAYCLVSINDSQAQAYRYNSNDTQNYLEHNRIRDQQQQLMYLEQQRLQIQQQETLRQHQQFHQHQQRDIHSPNMGSRYFNMHNH